MNVDIIGELQADKVIESMKLGKRLDKRKMDEYRNLEINTGMFQNADGSAWVKLGNTEVIAGIKLTPEEPYPDMPDEGTISVGAELIPLASPTFESGPPKAEAIELARVVDRGIREGGMIDFKSLCIREKELAWVVFIDLYILNDDGNLFDACSIASAAALLNAKIPKLDKDDKIISKEFAGKLAIKNKPILSTFAKIGNSIVLDPTNAEEKAMTARISIATVDDGKVPALQKGLAGSFTAEELSHCVDIAAEKSKTIRNLL